MPTYILDKVFLLVASCALLLQPVESLKCSRNDIFEDGGRTVKKRPGCTVFDATSKLHQNGYDSLLSTLSGQLDLEDMVLGYACLDDVGVASLAD